MPSASPSPSLLPPGPFPSPRLGALPGPAFGQVPAPVSYADIASRGPKQTPEEAAAPQPPQVIPNESASTASLVDVDMPSVHTVSSEFLEQDVQTQTQADRIEREHSIKEEAKEQTERAKKSSAKKARKADNWLAAQFSQLSDESANALVFANLAAVVGLSGWMGWKAWGLYDKGRLSWQSVGVGAAVLAGVGVFESVIGRGLYRGKSS
ncbi:hypothetical protein S7711_06556 [Stachybotrys chartarum IBT 7711]|uniref:Mitochondrial outer membrane protein OM14 C-terminal domain-containing protein n=1 Tax=Stachybotrys chartarum (strain CBS 109288 / IBT 7711) TaxID=1280523 RepID=A0A084B2M5_STACB|nr:hypothetical protein S7711_06556 [Stachybotrys chartarum IBT 7711]